VKRLAITAVLLLAAFAPQASAPRYPAPDRADIEPLIADLYYTATAAAISVSEEKVTAADLPELLRSRKTVSLTSLADCHWDDLDSSGAGYRCRAQICLPVAYPIDCDLQQRSDTVELQLQRDGQQWRLAADPDYPKPLHDLGRPRHYFRSPDSEWKRTIGFNLGGCYRKAMIALQDETYPTTCSAKRIAMR
jgi:hypothetical protein